MLAISMDFRVAKTKLMLKLGIGQRHPADQFGNLTGNLGRFRYSNLIFMRDNLP